jgi:Family of unknown function (DUF5808)
VLLQALSKDGSVLVLENGYAGEPLRDASSFLLVDARQMTPERVITLHGDFLVDAVSPNGRMLYLIQHVQADDLTRYVVRTYDLGTGRLLNRLIADRTQREWVMLGLPLQRVTSADGRSWLTIDTHTFRLSLAAARAAILMVIAPPARAGAGIAHRSRPKGSEVRSAQPASLNPLVEDERFRRLVRALWVALVGAAVADAVRNKRDHGELFGFVPYDFRLPTPERARQHTWNPESPRVLTPTTFGVGWSLNLGRIARLAHLA